MKLFSSCSYIHRLASISDQKCYPEKIRNISDCSFKPSHCSRIPPVSDILMTPIKNFDMGIKELCVTPSCHSYLQYNGSLKALKQPLTRHNTLRTASIPAVFPGLPHLSCITAEFDNLGSIVLSLCASESPLIFMLCWWHRSVHYSSDCCYFVVKSSSRMRTSEFQKPYKNQFPRIDFSNLNISKHEHSPLQDCVFYLPKAQLRHRVQCNALCSVISFNVVIVLCVMCEPQED